MNNDENRETQEPSSPVLSEQQKDEKDSYRRGVNDQKKSSKVIIICASFLALVLGGLGGFGIFSLVQAKKEAEKEKAEAGISTLTVQIYNYLKNNWLFAGTYEDFQKTFNQYMIQGMLNNDNDPYTFFTSTAEGQGLNTTGTGNYGFTSNYYAQKASDGQTYGGLRLVEIEDGEAKKAGFVQGDVLIAAKKPTDSTWTYLQDVPPAALNTVIYPAKSGESMDLRYISKADSSIKDITLATGDYTQIAAYKIGESSASGQNELAIRISTFLGNSSDNPVLDSKNIINDYLSSHASIDNLVFDCRDNGGGYTNLAEDLANFFLPKGKINYQIGDNDGNISHTYYQTGNPLYSTEQVKHISIILNENSASATELFANALKCNGMAKVYGRQSFGKGIGQIVFNLCSSSDKATCATTDSDYEGTLRITTFKVYTPDGTSIHGVGITPDEVTNDFYTYRQDLVPYPYIADSYRLTYAQEQSVLKSLQKLDAFKNQTDFISALKAFQTAQNITVSGEYDVNTLYRLYGEEYAIYYAKASQEVTTVMAKQ
jgi:carboxyl-terminal processing protease